MNTTILQPVLGLASVVRPISCIMQSLHDAIDVIHPHVSEKDEKSQQVLKRLRRSLRTDVFWDSQIREPFNFFLDSGDENQKKVHATTCQFVSVFAHLCNNSKLSVDFFAPGKPELILDSNILFEDSHLILGLDPSYREMKLMIRLVESGKHIPPNLYQKVFVID